MEADCAIRVAASDRKHFPADVQHGGQHRARAVRQQGSAGGGRLGRQLDQRHHRLLHRHRDRRGRGHCAVLRREGRSKAVRRGADDHGRGAGGVRHMHVPGQTVGAAVFENHENGEDPGGVQDGGSLSAHLLLGRFGHASVQRRRGHPARRGRFAPAADLPDYHDGHQYRAGYSLCDEV